MKKRKKMETMKTEPELLKENLKNFRMILFSVFTKHTPSRSLVSALVLNIMGKWKTVQVEWVTR